MTTRKSSVSDDVHYTGDVKLYTRRWFLLGLFMLFTATVAVHWMQFATITNLVSRYYGVSPTWVEWTSILIMAGRAFLLFPSLFLMDKLVNFCSTSSSSKVMLQSHFYLVQQQSLLHGRVHVLVHWIQNHIMRSLTRFTFQILLLLRGRVSPSRIKF